MKYQTIEKGKTFTINGCLLRFVDIEKGTVVLEDVAIGKKFCYGLAALQYILMPTGYMLADEVKGE